MIQRIIHRLLLRRHFWRHATFSEIAELYASRMMTMFALRFVMVFAAVYLYKLEYSLTFIALFWAGYFLLKGLVAWPAAKFAARFGPKHGLLWANVIFALGMVFLFGVDGHGFQSLLIWGVLHAIAGCLNNLCYNIDFSKVKHDEHAGKEIGYMNIIEKIAAGLSPLLGGLVATVFGPAVAVVLAAVLFLGSAIPLFRSAEPTMLRQKLTLHGFPWRLTLSNFPAQAASGVDAFSSTTVWSIFIAVVVFASDGDEIYVKIGAFASLTLFVALASSYMFGRLIDRRQGYLLLRFSVIFNALTHIFRPTVGSALGIVANNVANEIATTGYTMAFIRGVFDTADRSGARIVYLCFMEMILSFGAAIAALLLAALCWYFDSQSALSIYFGLIGLAVLLIMTPQFALYRNKQ